jgi:hypothetical protein
MFVLKKQANAALARRQSLKKLVFPITYMIGMRVAYLYLNGKSLITGSAF